MATTDDKCQGVVRHASLRNVRHIPEQSDYATLCTVYSETMSSESALLDQFEKSTTWNVLRKNYELVPGFMQFGEGDMLADDGDSLVAIECKWIDLTSSGKTVKVRRTKHRKKVAEQALLHASYVKIRTPHRRVQAMTLTNEYGLKVIADDVSLPYAKRCVLDFLKTVWHGYIPQCAMPELTRLFVRDG